MPKRPNDPFVENLAAGVVSDIVPVDLLSFPDVAKGYFSNRRRAMAPKRHGDKPLEFGIEHLDLPLVIVILYVSDKVVDAISGKAADEAWRLIDERFHRRSASSSVPVSLSEEDLETIEKTAKDVAKEVGVSDAMATEIASAMRNRLAGAGH